MVLLIYGLLPASGTFFLCLLGWRLFISLLPLTGCATSENLPNHPEP